MKREAFLFVVSARRRAAQLHLGQEHASVERVNSQDFQASTHRKRRDPSPVLGMILHQDGSRHEWVPGKKWDLIVTMDDATGEHYGSRS